MSCEWPETWCHILGEHLAVYSIKVHVHIDSKPYIVLNLNIIPT